VYLYGNVGPDYGSATLSINDQVVESAINLTVRRILDAQSIADISHPGQRSTSFSGSEQGWTLRSRQRSS